MSPAMSRIRMPKTRLLLASTMFVLALGACSSEDAAEEGHAASEASAHQSSDLPTGLPAGHIDAGEKQANVKGKATGQSCIDCHGKDGNAPIDPSYPKLGGQYADYLAYSLQMYRNGDRQHALMSQQAKDLSDQQIADLAAYFNSRPSQLRDLSDVH